MRRPRIPHRTARSSGFTLIEIALVLVIAALIIAAGLGMTVALLESAKARATRQNLESVKIALEGFISRNGRLPCPAVEGLPPADINYGIEAATPGTCTGTVDLPGAAGPPAIDAAKRGVVPWKTLGLTTEVAYDGWGHQTTYMVTASATSTTFDTIPGIRGSLYVHSAVPVAAGLPGPPANGNQINACSTTANDNVCNKAAVVILLSGGRNGFGSYLQSGARLPLPTGAAEVENTNDDRFVVSSELLVDFDDVLLPLAPNDVLGPLTSQGAIKSERALLLDRARQVIVQMLGEVVINRSGSSPNILYPLPAPGGALSTYTFQNNRFNVSCDSPFNTTGVVTAVVVGDTTGDASQIVDAWGRTFKFARASATIDSSESCKTPVAVISRGPDGLLNTADDFVYYSPMAEWKEILGKAGW